MAHCLVSSPLLILATATASAQYPAAPAIRPRPLTRASNVTYAIADWRRLRAEQRLQLRRLCPLPHRQSGLARGNRSSAAGPRRRCGRARTPATVLAFFANDPPATGNGFARLADAYAASGRMGEALAAARSAWASADLGGDRRAGDLEPLRRAASPPPTTIARVDALLFAKKPDDAARFYSLHDAGAARGLRCPDRDAARMHRTPKACYQAVMGQVTTDAGLMMDRARYLRASNYRAGRARPCRAPAQFHLPARRPRAFLRHAADARERCGPGPAVGYRLQYRPAPRATLCPPGPTSASSRSASATITPA